MKTLLIIGILFFNSSSLFGLNKDFDHELSMIVVNFKNNLDKEEDCLSDIRNLDDLIEETEAIIKKEEYDDYSPNDLKALLKEMKAIKKFIQCFTDTNNFPITLNDFYLANQRIRAEFVKLVNYNYCVKIVKFIINNHVAYSVWNDSSENYKLNIDWRNPNGMHSGSNEMGVFTKNFRIFYTNDGEIEKEKIIVTSVNCESFSANFY